MLSTDQRKLSCFGRPVLQYTISKRRASGNMRCTTTSPRGPSTGGAVKSKPRRRTVCVWAVQAVADGCWWAGSKVRWIDLVAPSLPDRYCVVLYIVVLCVYYNSWAWGPGPGPGPHPGIKPLPRTALVGHSRESQHPCPEASRHKLAGRLTALRVSTGSNEQSVSRLMLRKSILLCMVGRQRPHRGR